MKGRNIYIIESQSLQALIQAGNQVLAAAPVTVRSLPHIVTGLGADQTEVFFGTSRFRSVIVGKIKMSDAMIKSGKAELFHIVVRREISKIMPQSKRDGGKNISKK